MKRLVPFLLPLLALAVAIALRLYAIEPSQIGHACDPAPWSGWCGARTALIMTFRFQELGWAALAVGLLATLVRRPWLGQLALALGFAGMVLYSYEPAAVGALLGTLVILRPRRGPRRRGDLPAAETANSGTR